MKKLVCAALALAFLLAWPAGRAFAALLPAPQSALRSQTAQEYVFNVESPLIASYETQRTERLAALRKTATDAQIAASGYASLLFPAGLLCEASAEGGAFVPVRLYPPAQTEIALSLTADVLPALAAAGQYRNEAFSFSLRFTGAADTDVGYVALSDPGEAFCFSCPASRYIEYRLPDGADNGRNPSFLFGEPGAPLRLADPVKPGWLFDGWQTADGAYVETVPTDLPHVVLTARFTPRTYRITYVLTTREGFFTRVPNDANPKQYTCGEETPLYDLPPAIGSLTAPKDYVFRGWYETPDYSGDPVTAIPPERTGDVILYAKWLTEDEALAEDVALAGWGDLNEDGKVTAADARLALRSAVGLETLPDALIARADFARLGTLNAGCARTLLRVAVGLETMPEVLKAYGRI